MSAAVNSPVKPVMVKPEPGAVLPAELTERAQWVCWSYENRNGKWTKAPRTTSGGYAKSDTSATWSTFREVVAASERREDFGIGYVFERDVDPFTGIDVDNCLLPDGTLKPWATAILERFRNTYAEVSPSGKGIKIWARASLAGLVAGTGTQRAYGDGKVEVYHFGRFFTMTGRRFNDAPLSITDHQADVEWLLSLIGAAAKPDCDKSDALADATKPASAPEPPKELTADEVEALLAKLEAARANIPKFADLWLGGACGYYTDGKPDSSRADIAFCYFLGFHLELGASAIDAAFRASERMRPKWDERHYSDGATYGQRTVEKALQRATQERQRSSPKGCPVPIGSPAVGGGTIEDLNAMPVFNGVGVTWEKFEMSGDLIFGYAAGQRVRWENTAELLSFGKSQAVILKYLRVLIPSPSRAKIKATWEPAAGQMVRLATVINAGDEMQTELSDLLPMCFRRAGSPVARSDSDVFQFMIQIQGWRRDPYTEDPINGSSAPGPFVFVYDGSVFVNAHKLRLWASLPRVTATMIRKAEMTRELASMGFKYHRSFERVQRGARATMDLWRGPLSSLGEALEASDIPGAETRTADFD